MRWSQVISLRWMRAIRSGRPMPMWRLALGRSRQVRRWHVAKHGARRLRFTLAAGMVLAGGFASGAQAAPWTVYAADHTQAAVIHDVTRNMSILGLAEGCFWIDLRGAESAAQKINDTINDEAWTRAEEIRNKPGDLPDAEQNAIIEAETDGMTGGQQVSNEDGTLSRDHDVCSDAHAKSVTVATLEAGFITHDRAKWQANLAAAEQLVAAAPDADKVASLLSDTSEFLSGVGRDIMQLNICGGLSAEDQRAVQHGVSAIMGDKARERGFTTEAGLEMLGRGVARKMRSGMRYGGADASRCRDAGAIGAIRERLNEIAGLGR